MKINYMLSVINISLKSVSLVPTLPAQTVEIKKHKYEMKMRNKKVEAAAKAL